MRTVREREREEVEKWATRPSRSIQRRVVVV